MGPIKEICFFPFSVFFFLILFTFSLWTGRWEQIGAIEEMCNHFSSLAPYSTPVASNAQIHSNPSAPSTIFSRHMSTSFDQKESTYLFALDIKCIWSSHSKKTCSFKIPKEIWAPFYKCFILKNVLHGFSLILFIHPTPLQKERASTDLFCDICLCWVWWFTIWKEVGKYWEANIMQCPRL